MVNQELVVGSALEFVLFIHVDAFNVLQYADHVVVKVPQVNLEHRAVNRHGPLLLNINHNLHVF